MCMVYCIHFTMILLKNQRHYQLDNDNAWEKSQLEIWIIHLINAIVAFSHLEHSMGQSLPQLLTFFAEVHPGCKVQTIYFYEKPKKHLKHFCANLFLLNEVTNYFDARTHFDRFIWIRNISLFMETFGNLTSIYASKHQTKLQTF